MDRNVSLLLEHSMILIPKYLQCGLQGLEFFVLIPDFNLSYEEGIWN